MYEIILVDFGKRSEMELSGRHYALVVSNKEFTEKTGLFMVCPLSTKKTNRNNNKSKRAHECGYHPYFTLNGKKAFAVTEQVQSISSESIINAAPSVDLIVPNNFESRLKGLLYRMFL